MKARTWLWLNLFVLGLLLGGVRAARAADDKKDDPTGNWSWTFMIGDGNELKVTAKFKKEGDKVTGAITARERESKIEKGQIKDGIITFQVTREFNDNKFVMKYKGELSGDTIEGKAEGDRGGQAFELDWKAKREKDTK